MVPAAELADIRDEEGRSRHGIYPPLLLSHYAQGFAGDVASFAREIMADKGIDEATAHSVASRLAALGISRFATIAEFGYGVRVLEERAGVVPAEQQTQTIEAAFPD